MSSPPASRIISLGDPEQVTSLILIVCCHEKRLVGPGCESAVIQSLFGQIPINSSGNFLCVKTARFATIACA